MTATSVLAPDASSFTIRWYGRTAIIIYDPEHYDRCTNLDDLERYAPVSLDDMIRLRRSLLVVMVSVYDYPDVKPENIIYAEPGVYQLAADNHLSTIRLVAILE